jgi:hypothetical protein
MLNIAKLNISVITTRIWAAKNRIWDSNGDERENYNSCRITAGR